MAATGSAPATIRTRSGDSYKPSTIRSYEQALRGPQGGKGGLLRELGLASSSRTLTLDDVQDYADRLLAAGAQPSTIRNAIMPVRVICAWRRREVPVNPTDGLRLPAVRSGRDRIASPAEAELLLARARGSGPPAVGDGHVCGAAPRRADGTALAGRRPRLGRAATSRGRGIRRSARWSRRSPRPASDACRSPPALRAYPRPAEARSGLPSPTRSSSGTWRAVQRLLASANARNRAWKAAKLDPICLHECRHTFASLMIAAGVNAKALSTFMGHANISITLDRYGHLMPGAEDEAAGLMDAYLQAARASVK